MRLIITGKTRSGKSTAIHRLLSHALRQHWESVLLLDGKGSELHSYNALDLTYLGADELDRWEEELKIIANTLPMRYAKLTERGLREAAPGDPRYLVLADEIQRGTRDSKHGKEIKNALTLIAEQSAALGDVLILSTQREQYSIPTNVRANANAWLRMLGKGYFYLDCDGHAQRAGRVAYITPQDSLATIRRNGDGDDPIPLTLSDLPQVFGTTPPPDYHPSWTLYIGAPGSGKTHVLQHHRPICGNKSTRTVQVDLRHSHRDAIIKIIRKCSASIPPRSTIADLVEMARLTLGAEPTLLIIDNLHAGTSKTITNIITIAEAAAEVAIAANTPDTPAQKQKLDPFLTRAQLIRIEPLTTLEAEALAEKHLPDGVPKRHNQVRFIVRQGHGHPRTIVDLARRTQTGTISERRTIMPPQATTPRYNLLWAILIVAILGVFIIRYQSNGATAAALATIAIIVLRPLFIRSLRNTRS